MKDGARNKKTPGLSNSRLLELCRSLDAHHAQYVIMGGTACNLHGLIRATKDIDVLVPKDVENAEAVLKALAEIQTFGMAKELDPEQVATRPITVIGDIPRVDILTVAWKVKFDEAIKTAEHVKIDGVKVVYAGIDSLIKSKRTDRLQDLADIEKLKQITKR
jgi:predicted nucleotidyltransferase